MKQTPQSGWTPPEPAPRLTAFDTRMLDRLEMVVSQYRHWHSDNVTGLPREYVMSQRAVYMRMLRDESQSVAEELSRWL